MSFPETRHSLIRRLTAEGRETDWTQFLDDYWGPICEFVMRRSGLPAEDAEDVAGQVVEALLAQDLLRRWQAERSARLRTLICTVVRHILGNRARVAQRRREIERERGPELAARTDLPSIKALDATQDQLDAFYAAWAEQTIRRAVDAVFKDCHRRGRGDYFRVLYGRVCEGMTARQVAEALEIKLTDAENYHRAVRKQLSERLQQIVRTHVQRYCADAQVEAEFEAEWQRLGDYLSEHGGLEEAVRRAHDTEREAAAERLDASKATAQERLTTMLRRRSERVDGGERED